MGKPQSQKSLEGKQIGPAPVFPAQAGIHPLMAIFLYCLTESCHHPSITGGHMHKLFYTIFISTFSVGCSNLGDSGLDDGGPKIGDADKVKVYAPVTEYDVDWTGACNYAADAFQFILASVVSKNQTGQSKTDADFITKNIYCPILNKNLDCEGQSNKGGGVKAVCDMQKALFSENEGACTGGTVPNCLSKTPVDGCNVPATVKSGTTITDSNMLSDLCVNSLYPKGCVAISAIFGNQSFATNCAYQSQKAQDSSGNSTPKLNLLAPCVSNLGKPKEYEALDPSKTPKACIPLVSRNPTHPLYSDLCPPAQCLQADCLFTSSQSDSTNLAPPCQGSASATYEVAYSRAICGNCPGYSKTNGSTAPDCKGDVETFCARYHSCYKANLDSPNNQLHCDAKSTFPVCGYPHGQSVKNGNDGSACTYTH